MSALHGLTVVPGPSLTDPLVYDAGRIYAVVARAFRVERSTEYAPAFKGDKVALKFTGRFGGGLTVPGKTIRSSPSRLPHETLPRTSLTEPQIRRRRRGVPEQVQLAEQHAGRAQGSTERQRLVVRREAHDRE